MQPHPPRVREWPPGGYVRQAELLQAVPFSHSTLWRKVKRGEFPAPVKLSERITAWKVESVQHWLNEKAEA